jgi:3-deoxy-manno-octulosonate cytidylyltransferase (CMP-KDO synthetase)
MSSGLRIIGVIPARMAASRFPGKPLALLHGRPMLEHVFRRTAACHLLDEVVIATCDEEIVCAAQRFGARAVMTSSSHERASDRVAEAVETAAADIVVMVQGDEPMIQPSMIDAVVASLIEDPSLGCANLAAPIRSEREFADPNTIKVVRGLDGRALYFSRAPIPAETGAAVSFAHRLKQVCVIPFRRDALRRFTELPRGPLEQAESIDMLRFLENGMRVQLVSTTVETHAVDTPDDLARVAAVMANQPGESWA